MNLKEYIHSEIRKTLLEAVNEDKVNDFFYMDLKKHMWNRRKDYSNKIKKLNGLEKTEYLEDLYIKLNGKFARDIKGHGMELYKRLVNDKVIKEDTELDQAFLKAKPVEEETKRDYKKEYEKYGKSKKAKKYRAELNKYNRDKGTYGNGDGKDASHKGGKIVGFEAQSKNRGRREKSRLKKEATFVPVSGTKAGGTLHLDRRKYQLKKDVKDVQIGNYIVTLPKGTILYNLAGGVLADHKSLEQYETRSQKYFKKSTYRGIMIRQKEQTIRDIEKNSKVLESVNEAKFYITRNLGRGQGKSLVGGYDLKRDKKLPPKVFKSYKDAQKEVERLERGGSMGGQMTAYIITDKDMNMLKPNGKKMFESLKEGKKKLPKFKNIPSWARYLAQHSDGQWYFYEETPTMIKFKDGSGGAWKQDGNQVYSGVKTNGKDWDKIPTYYNVKSGKITESSEQIDEKLITFSNRAPYGQIVFMAGGAGSGKGFAIDNFIDSAGFRVRDVDEMKKAVGKLDQLGKFSVDKWYKKYGKKLSDKPKNGGLSPKAHIEEFVLGKGLSISDISKDLKNPNNVASLHYIVDSMGLKDKWLISMLSGKDNKETLPNLLFDITAKKVSSITDVITPLIANGYDAKNIHLIWVLSNFHVAIKANKDRDRMVPEDILLQTHEGASKTMWEVMTKILPKGLNGRIDVILNKRAETVPYVDSKGNEIKVEPNQMNKLKAARTVVKGFKSLPIKKQGGGIQPEKAWKMLLKSWILDNAPKTIDLSQQVDEGKNDYFKTAGEAVEFAKKAAEKKGFDIDEDDWNSQITMGGKYNRLRPGVGKTHSFQIGLLKKGKPQRKGLAISLYGMDSGKYELTHYIN